MSKEKGKLIESPQQTGWISVDERLPDLTHEWEDNGTVFRESVQVLVQTANKYLGKPTCRVALFEGKSWSEMGGDILKVTHWKSLAELREAESPRSHQAINEELADLRARWNAAERRVKELEAPPRQPSADSLTFNEFQSVNKHRCEQKFHLCGDWLPSGWPLAIAGEAGELCNLIKKIIRGDFTFESQRGEILKELADVITYCDLMISAMGANTGEVVAAKFDEVSKRVGYTAATFGELREVSQHPVPAPTSFNHEEEAVLQELMSSQGLSRMATLRQALRTYQLVRSGRWRLEEINPMRKMEGGHPEPAKGGGE